MASCDFNADGYADVAIGAAGERIGALTGPDEARGTVSILYGSAQGLRTTGNQLFDPTVVDVADVWGTVLACGDLNGDGRADLAIGSGTNPAVATPPVCCAFEEHPEGLTVIYGSPTGLDGSTAVHITSAQATGQSGDNPYVGPVRVRPGRGGPRRRRDRRSRRPRRRGHHEHPGRHHRVPWSVRRHRPGGDHDDLRGGDRRSLLPRVPHRFHLFGGDRRLRQRRGRRPGRRLRHRPPRRPVRLRRDLCPCRPGGPDDLGRAGPQRGKGLARRHPGRRGPAQPPGRVRLRARGRAISTGTAGTTSRSARRGRTSGSTGPAG